MTTNHQLNGSGVPDQKTQESLEGLTDSEVRNLNNEVRQPAPNGAEKINRLVEGDAGGTSPADDVDVDQVPEGEQKYWEHRANPAVRNADNELLGAIRLRGLTIGCVEEVNGPG